METAFEQTSAIPQHEGVKHLFDLAYRHSWHPDALPWDRDQGQDVQSFPDAMSLLARTAAFQAMNRDQRLALKRSEFASHLSALADGERRATKLAGETVLLAPEDDADGQAFLGTLIADEAKHFSVLRRYVEAKLEHEMGPHPALEQVFNALYGEHDYALNLLVGQVVLEGAAASLLNSLLVVSREGLLRELLRRISRDEARHMRFAYLASALEHQELSRARRRRIEELLFEAAWAAAASLVAVPTWDEFDLPREEATDVTLEALRQRGVFAWYTRVVIRQLSRLGFPTARLARDIERHLEEKLRAEVER